MQARGAAPAQLSYDPNASSRYPLQHPPSGGPFNHPQTNSANGFHRSVLPAAEASLPPHTVPTPLPVVMKHDHPSVEPDDRPPFPETSIRPPTNDQSLPGSSQSSTNSKASKLVGRSGTSYFKALQGNFFARFSYVVDSGLQISVKRRIYSDRNSITKLSSKGSKYGWFKAKSVWSCLPRFPVWQKDKNELLSKFSITYARNSKRNFNNCTFFKWDQCFYGLSLI